MANRALARKKRCNIIPISPNALATSDVISPPRFAVRMSQIPWGTSIGYSLRSPSGPHVTACVTPLRSVSTAAS